MTFLLGCLFLLPLTMVVAQTVESVGTDSLKHHVIIAVDWAPAPTKWQISDETKEAVKELINYAVKDGRDQKRAVLALKDYYSCVGFRTDEQCGNLKQYVQAVSDLNRKILYRNNSEKTTLNMCIETEWDNWMKSAPFGRQVPSGFSLISVAKPYCLNYFNQVETKPIVHRTFMIVVSDYVFNGDPYDEVANWGRFYKEKTGFEMNDKEVFPLCYAVNQTYFMHHLKTIEIKNGGFSWSNPKGYVELLEFVPLQKNFNLATVLDMPVMLKAKRIRGGKYRCELVIRNRHNQTYQPLCLKASLNDKLLKQWQEGDMQETLTFTFDIVGDKRPKELKVKGWVKYMDNVYNATILSPSPQATEEAGRLGLTVNLGIEYEEETLMPDILWFSFFPDDQATASLIWELIFWLSVVLIVIICLFCLFNKYQYFTPEVSEITIKISKPL